MKKRLIYLTPHLSTTVASFFPFPPHNRKIKDTICLDISWDDQGVDGAIADEEGSIAWNSCDIDMLVVVGLEASVYTTWNMSLQTCECNSLNTDIVTISCIVTAPYCFQPSVIVPDHSCTGELRESQS